VTWHFETLSTAAYLEDVAGQYASRGQLKAYELMAGDQMTSFGPFSEVIKKEFGALNEGRDSPMRDAAGASSQGSKECPADRAVLRV
jgi:hypothetical protein